MRNFISDAVYIVSDGTSAFQIYGCDIESHIDDLEVLQGPFADTPSNQRKIEGLVEKYNDEINGTSMFNENVKKINADQLQSIVLESVKDMLSNISNKLGGFRDGSPSSLKDVIMGDGWTVGPVQKGNGTMLVRVYHSNNPFGNDFDLDELVDDINIYFQDSHKPLVATAIENNGAYIRVDRKSSLKEYRIAKPKEEERPDNWHMGNDKNSSNERKELYNQYAPEVNRVLADFGTKIIGYGFKKFSDLFMFVFVVNGNGINVKDLQNSLGNVGERIIVKQHPNGETLYLVFPDHIKQ